MIKLWESTLLDIIPECFKPKPEVQALSYAIEMEFGRLCAYLEAAKVLCGVDNTSEEALDLLALDLRTQYYDASLDIDTKRKLIKGTLVWYMTAGTPKALTDLLNYIFEDSTLAEWPEYGGQPFFFQVATDDILLKKKYDKFNGMLDTVKNARSLMEKFVLNRPLDKHLYVFIGIFMSVNNSSTSNAPSSGKLYANASGEILTSRDDALYYVL